MIAAGGTWLSWRSEADGAVTAIPALAGASLFQAKGCAVCHTGPESAPRVNTRVSLRNAPEWAATRRDDTSAEDYLRESMLDPTVFTSPAWEGAGPFDAMPSLDLDEAEVEALIDFLLHRDAA